MAQISSKNSDISRLLIYAILSFMIATYSCQGCPGGQFTVSPGVCAPCDVRCENCTGPTVNDCTTCLPSTNRELVGNICSCEAGFFEVDALTANCDSCDSKCKTCFGAASNCTSCFGSTEIAPLVNQFRYLSSYSCICIDGYFEDSGADICVICNYACSTCFGSARNCTLCSSADRQLLPYCDCKTGFYEKTADKDGCAACDTKCASCEICQAADNCGALDESICTSCAGLNRVTFNPADNQTHSCRCEDGYYLANPTDLNCTPCPYNCATCVKCLTDVICLSCKGTNRNSTPTQTCTDGVAYTQLTCPCNNGTYDISGVPNCATCPSNCFNCSSSGATCLSCNGSNRNTSSYCMCNSGYQEPTSGPNCVLICDQSEFRNASDNCNCNSTYYSASTTGNCTPCENPCLTCSGSATYCLTCNTALANRNNNPPFCNCRDGYFLSGTDCVACNVSRCGTCVTNENTCLTCTGIGRTTPPGCSCDPGYIEDTGVCKKCHYTCSTCSGVADTQCTACIDTTTRDFSSNTCLCKPKYFEVGTYKCSQCAYYCATCENYSTNCLTCEDSTQRVLANQCRCTANAGYYDDGKSAACQACSTSCLNCTGTATNCTACRDNRRAPPDCACAEGFYADGSNVCQPCTAPCKTCSVVATNCTSCLDSLYRKNDSACSCQDGYTLVGSVCTVCDPPCLTCSTSTSNCDSCKGLYRDPGTSTCSCLDGYYQHGTEQDCRKCNYKCKTCTNGTECIDVNTNTFRDPTTHLCIDGYFDLNFTEICVQCDTVLCAKCVGSSTNCTECSSTVTRNLSDSCACSTGYFLSGTSCLNCVTETTKCETCSSSSLCTSCNKDHTNRNRSNNCECDEGYFQNGTGHCQPCHYRCKTCSGGNAAANCLTCQDPDHRGSAQPCACLEQAGYYDDGSSALCKKCNYTCQNCSDFNTCIQACSDPATRTLANNCACNIGYYDAGVEVCPQCNYKCASCETTATNCLTCSTNRNISNACACNEGRVEVSQVCELCMDYCDGCIGTRTNCTRCLGTNRNLTAPDCACLTGFYDDVNDGSPNCLPCSKQCLTCSLTASNCIICKTNGTNRLGNAPACNCHSMFYENSTDTVGKCAECPRKCATCDVNEVCEDCINSDTRLSSAPDCSCRTGYLESGLKDCLKCHAKCEDCGPDVDTCTSCTPNHNGTRSTTLPCGCLTKHFEVGAAACSACAFQCQECSLNSKNCTQCIDGANRVTFPSCLCVPGTYEGGFQYCSECPLRCGREGECNNLGQCKGTCGAHRNTSNNCACNSGYHDFTLGQHNLTLQECKLDCTSPECEPLAAKYTITDDLAEKVYSHYSFSREENIYNSTYVQVYAMGFSQKIRIFGISKSTTTPTSTEIIKFDSADYTGSSIVSLCYAKASKKLVAGALTKLFVIDLEANTTTVVTTIGSLTISTITHLMNINETDSVFFSTSNGYLVWYNLTSSALIQSYLVKSGLSILKFDSDTRNIWMAGDDNNIYVQSILRPSQKSTVKTNHTSQIKNVLVTSKYVVSVSEDEFIIHDLSTLRPISRQTGGGIYSDKIPGSDVIAILHTTPIIDLQVYNLTDFTIQQVLYQKRQKIYELKYERDGQMIGPFYDKKVGVQLGVTKYSTYKAAKEACEADSSCKSLYYHQDNDRATDRGQFWILSAETVPTDLTAGELAENEIRKVYLKQQNDNDYMFYSKSSSYFALKTQIEKKTLFVDVCGAGLYLEIRPNSYYKGLCASSCSGEGEPEILQYNKYCLNRCPPGQSYVNNACTKCPHKCALNCDSSQNCLEGCKGDRIFSSQCTCPTGTFEDGVREFCQECSAKCLVCSVNSTNCQQCAENRQTEPDCQCLEGYFDDNKTAGCIPCFSDLCAKCKNSGANQCIQCKSGFYFSPESEQSDQGTCYEECPDGTKEDKDTMTCIVSEGISKEAVTIIVLGTLVTAIVGTTSFLLVKTGFIGAKAVTSQLGAAQAYSKVGGEMIGQASQQVLNAQPNQLNNQVIP